MDTLQFRLDILNKSGIITDKERDVLEKWIDIIMEFSKDFDSVKLERMITHCAMMMKRKRENEDIGRCGCLSCGINRRKNSKEI